MVGRSTRSAIERFFSKTMLGESCWLWTGRLKAGYGRLSLTARPSVAVQAHRFAFEHFIGPIPSGLTLDHLCHTADLDCPGGPSCHHRRCVNPLHLEPVPLADNVLRGRGVAARNRRKATCAHGHPFDEANTIRTVAPSGRPGRHCRACRDAHNAEWSNGKRKIEGVATIAPQAFVIFFSMLTLVTWLYMTTVRGAA